MADIYGQRIQSTVNTEYLPFLVDQVLTSNVVAQRVIRAAKKFEFTGRQMRQAIAIDDEAGYTTFRGMTALPTDVKDNLRYLEWNPAFATTHCALPGDELSIAQSAGENAVINLLKSGIEHASLILADNIGRAFYESDGTGTDFNGLAALVDDGTSVANIGGLSRSTYSVLQGTVTGSGGALTLAKMDTLHDNVSSGSIAPTIIPTTKTVKSLLEQLLRPYQHINTDAEVSMVKNSMVPGGFKTPHYRGAPVVSDEKAVSGTLYMVNENFLDFMGLSTYGNNPIKYSGTIKGNDYSSVEGLGFSTSDMFSFQNAYGFIGRIYFAGNFTTKRPKSHGKLTGITSA